MKKGEIEMQWQYYHCLQWDLHLSMVWYRVTDLQMTSSDKLPALNISFHIYGSWIRVSL